MATRTVKICDRCKAEHIQEVGSNHSVQRIETKIPLGLSIHGVKATPSKDLCEPCRKGLYELVKTYLEGPQ